MYHIYLTQIQYVLEKPPLVVTLQVARATHFPSCGVCESTPGIQITELKNPTQPRFEPKLPGRALYVLRNGDLQTDPAGLLG